MRTVAIFFLGFILFYAGLEKTGFFTAHGARASEILLTTPMLVSALLCALVLIFIALSKRGRLQVRQWLLLLGVVLVAAGLCVSFFLRFQGEVVLTEGQELEGQLSEFQEGHVWLGKRARIPFIGLKLKKVAPVLSRDGSKLIRVKALFQVFRNEERQKGEIEAGDLLPSYFYGMFINVCDYGISPRYSFRDQDGNELDAAWVFLKTFPPGTEDYFRLLMPHTFYVRYYPDSENANKPVFGLRITRNKEILFNGSAHLREAIPFDNASIAFEEVRQWTKVTIIKDPGLPFIAAGMLFLIVSCISRMARAFFPMRLRASRSSEYVAD